MGHPPTVAITKLAGEPQGGFILPPDTYTAGHSELIVDLAMRHRLPAIYSLQFFTAEGGLAFYGIDIIDLEPISKLSEQDNEAGELDKAEEVNADGSVCLA